MKRRYKVGWALVALAALLPWLALLTAGGYWLWVNHYYREWLWALLACSGVAWIAGRALQRRQPPAGYRDAFRLPLGTVLSPRDEAARREVEAYAEVCCQREDLAFDQAAPWLAIAREVVGIVARHYRPGAEHPELNIPLTGLFQISEKVLRDIRLELLDKIPASHIVTLQDGLNLARWYDRITDLSLLWRLSRLLLNPLGALTTEASTVLLGRASKLPLRAFQQQAVAFFIHRVGLYAIELYSGRLTVGDHVAPSTCAPSDPGADPACRPVTPEPLRLLVCGQTKAGKSTLVNRLCESLCAPVDCIPCTGRIEGYRLRREGLLDSVILDSPGYGATESWLRGDEATTLDEIDLILLVTAATGAARQPDRGFLDTLRAHYAARPHRRSPPVVVVVTRVDQLRPVREWQPPYDLDPPASAKARNIVAALDAVAEDLALSEDTPRVPVCVPEDYNLDALWVAIAGKLPEALQANLLRCHARTLTRDRIDQLGRQFLNGGRWLLDMMKERLP